MKMTMYSIMLIRNHDRVVCTWWGFNRWPNIAINPQSLVEFERRGDKLKFEFNDGEKRRIVSYPLSPGPWGIPFNDD